MAVLSILDYATKVRRCGRVADFERQQSHFVLDPLLTGSLCSILNNALAWDRLGLGVSRTIRATLFCTRCNFLMQYSTVQHSISVDEPRQDQTTR